MQTVTTLIATVISNVYAFANRRILQEERGDVPGWVLIAAMSAGLVILIWALAGPLLAGVFEDAVNRVTGNF
ncbi:hypothetical protein [Gulosibacter bifidus]|uniref:Uncharacterized protein n=1 Tax=Gulosibacter bifidus TaxID=272239 RepID=A0ABW5RI13_9MICO